MISLVQVHDFASSSRDPWGCSLWTYPLSCSADPNVNLRCSPQKVVYCTILKPSYNMANLARSLPVLPSADEPLVMPYHCQYAVGSRSSAFPCPQVSPIPKSRILKKESSWATHLTCHSPSHRFSKVVLWSSCHIFFHPCFLLNYQSVEFSPFELNFDSLTLCQKEEKYSRRVP